MTQAISTAAPSPTTDTVFELRRYTLKPTQRETLITLFDTAFVEAQEAVGMRVVGQFRDRAQPHQFVWFRGFSDQAGRSAALPRFYEGAVWTEHGPAANATMIDSDDVLMLKPAGTEPAFADLPPRPSGAFAEPARSILVATHHYPAEIAEEAMRREAAHIASEARAAQATILASLISDHHPNGFPRLPIRVEANVVVTVVRPRERDVQTVAAVLAGLGPNGPALSVEIAELTPTNRSRVR